MDEEIVIGELNMTGKRRLSEELADTKSFQKNLSRISSQSQSSTPSKDLRTPVDIPAIQKFNSSKIIAEDSSSNEDDGSDNTLQRKE